jgi:hypothetical protein
MIMLIPQPPSLDLQRHVPIAQVISRASHQPRIRTEHLRHRLRRRPHLQHLAALSGQAIAIPQHVAAPQHDRHLLPALAARQEPTLLPIVVRQREHIAHCAILGPGSSLNSQHPAPQNKK